MNRFKKLLAAGIVLAAIFNSCKQDTGNLGANVLPSSDLIGVTEADTTTILTSMYLKDSVPTNQTGNSLLGSYSDPIFGTAKASIYTKIYSPIGASTANIHWVTDSIVDSAVLVLSLNSSFNFGFYGSLDQQTFVVDTLEKPLTSGKAYYSDTSIKYGSSIGISQITPNPVSDSLKIKLNRSWVTYIQSKLSADTGYYTNFSSLVKGLYITVSNPLQFPGQGALLYVNLGSTSAGIYFYYHSGTRTSRYDDQFINFPIQNSVEDTGVFFNHFDQNHATAPFASEHPQGKEESIDGDNLVYVQSMGGVVGRINFPNLYKNWLKLGRIVINKAELDMNLDVDDCPYPYSPPSQLYVYGIDKYGSPYQLPDELNSLTNYYGGGINGNTYTFNITQYIQKVIQGADTDRGLFIIPANDASSANRVVLYGAQHNAVAPSNNRMKLKIFYTPLPDTKAAKKH